jgi:hypothetical protein
MKKSLMRFILLSVSVLLEQSASPQTIVPLDGSAASRSYIQFIKCYSQNDSFYLISVPFDNEFPSLRGKTSVYKEGSPDPIYVFDRGFDSIEKDGNNLILSDNGEIIFYIIPWGADENREGLKSITIYKKGKIIKSYTEDEITGCDANRERCSLIYLNYSQVVDEKKSQTGTNNYRKVFKEGVDEKERFLSDFPVFSNGDTVYITDSKKKVHSFNMTEGLYVGSDSFERIFENIKSRGRFNRIELTRYDTPVFLEFPNLIDGQDSYESLAKIIGMKSVSISNRDDYQFKHYSFKMSCNIFKDGSLEIEDIEFFDDFPQDKVREYFEKNRFDTSSIPKVLDKWHIGNEYFYFRKPNDKIARQEKKREIKEASLEMKKQLKLETINGVYIPKNLGECFVELDKILKEIDKKEMQALPKREDMIEYHFSVGMRIRNDWGLWGSSRLQKYFSNKRIKHPDDMSGVILDFYHDWLNGKKETWKRWEKNPKSK